MGQRGFTCVDAGAPSRGSAASRQPDYQAAAARTHRSLSTPPCRLVHLLVPQMCCSSVTRSAWEAVSPDQSQANAPVQCNRRIPHFFSFFPRTRCPLYAHMPPDRSSPPSPLCLADPVSDPVTLAGNPGGYGSYVLEQLSKCFTNKPNIKPNQTSNVNKGSGCRPLCTRAQWAVHVHLGEGSTRTSGVGVE